MNGPNPLGPSTIRKNLCHLTNGPNPLGPNTIRKNLRRLSNGPNPLVPIHLDITYIT
jgi:hypothetical protein